jgi:hypothetical protein
MHPAVESGDGRFELLKTGLLLLLFVSISLLNVSLISSKTIATLLFVFMFKLVAVESNKLSLKSPDMYLLDLDPISKTPFE